MNDTLCPKCNSNNFETINDTPKFGKHSLCYLRCSDCKILLGVLEGKNIGHNVDGLYQEIQSLKNQLNDLTNRL